MLFLRRSDICVKSEKFSIHFLFKSFDFETGEMRRLTRKTSYRFYLSKVKKLIEIKYCNIELLIKI